MGLIGPYPFLMNYWLLINFGERDTLSSLVHSLESPLGSIRWFHTNGMVTQMVQVKLRGSQNKGRNTGKRPEEEEFVEG